MPRVLVVDDDAAVREALRTVLEYEGWEVVEAASGEEALEAIGTAGWDVVLLDVKMPRMDGLEVLAKLGAVEPAPPVVMISGHGDVATAVEATKLGAFDFLEKPIGRDRLLLTLRNARDVRRLEGENRSLKSRFDSEEMIGGAPAMERLRRTIERAAPTGATVLVTGPSGSGKELVARALHRRSKVAEGPFVRVNCAAIPDELIESELFGHEKGSFTGATRKQLGKFVVADGGTIFLDEVGDLSARAQAKVLRALQDGEIEPVGATRPMRVSVRVVAATNRDLKEAMAGGGFREDLFYRLNVVPIEVPPLAARRADVPELVRFFAARVAEEIGRRPPTFSPAAIELLTAYDWPGNVRELENLVERVLILVEREPIGPDDLPAELLRGGPGRAGGIVDPTLASSLSLQGFKDRAEEEFIRARLLEHGWNVSATAEAIGTPRSNLYKKIEQYGLKREEGG